MSHDKYRELTILIVPERNAHLYCTKLQKRWIKVWIKVWNRKRLEKLDVKKTKQKNQQKNLFRNALEC